MFNGNPNTLMHEVVFEKFKPFCPMLYVLTHWGRVTHICVRKLTVIASDNVNWTIGNKLQWNFYRNSNIFFEENTFENVVCEMLFISCRPQCVKDRTSHKMPHQPSRVCSSGVPETVITTTWQQQRKYFSNIPDSKVHGTNMGPSGADRTQVSPMLAPWTLLSGIDYLIIALEYLELLMFKM